MAALELFHIAPSRSSTVHWMLEELGEPFELRIVAPGGPRTPEHLALNPMGKVPVLRHGEVAICETPAICMYLAEAFPKAGLAPPVGDPRRGPYLQWMVFSTASLEPAIFEVMFKRPPIERPGAAGWGDIERVTDTLARALEKGPYLLGEDFSAADVVIGAQLNWGRIFGAYPSRPAFDAYLERVTSRPAFQRATAKDQALAAARETT